MEESSDNLDNLRKSFLNHLEKDRENAINNFFDSIVHADCKRVNYSKNMISSIDSTIEHINSSRDQDLLRDIESLREEKEKRNLLNDELEGEEDGFME